MDLLNNLGGSSVAKLAGEKAGDLVEQVVDNIMNKKDKAEGDGAKAQGEEKGGLDIGDALGMLGGDKDKDSGGGLTGALGKLF